jgi:2-polyprenyl-3-methyl-5-hydroxy-6-metoxy-1,4-benzoquinol methylase
VREKTERRLSGIQRRDEGVKADWFMEESISIIAADGQKLEFTGERIVPGKTAEQLFREHEERYLFARQYVAGKDVLDVACGTGVGTTFLRRAGARRVWGLDIDPDAIAFAKARYGDCEFAQSDATDLCLADSSMDVVVSFETLEHLSDQRKFLMECWRVLRPGGMFICSTPNTTIYRWYGMNPYHARELTTREFVRLLGEQFGSLALFSQGERIYLLYVLRLVLSRSLDRLKLKGQIKKLLGMNVPPRPLREEFSENGLSPMHDIRPYKAAWLRQSMYLIATCRKNFD